MASSNSAFGRHIEEIIQAKKLSKNKVFAEFERRFGTKIATFYRLFKLERPSLLQITRFSQALGISEYEVTNYPGNDFAEKFKEWHSNMLNHGTKEPVEIEDVQDAVDNFLK